MLRDIAALLLVLGVWASPTMSEADSEVHINHYSDYGVIEQSSLKSNGALGISNDPFGYSDAYTDNESSLQYLQVRYYNPLIMRFTQMDTYPLLNRYAYANENPIMNDDPSGHSAVGAGSSGSTMGFIGSFDQAAINFGAYFFTFEIGISVVTNAFPGLGALASMFSTVMVNTVASAAGTAAVSAYTHTKITAQLMGSSLVNGFVGQVFDSGGEYVIRELMLSKEVALSTARAVADTLGQGLYALGDVTTNPMFKVKTNYRELGIYYGISAVGYAVLNASAVGFYGDAYDDANSDYNTALSGEKKARSENEKAVIEKTAASSKALKSDQNNTAVNAAGEEEDYGDALCNALDKNEALEQASASFDSAQSHWLRVQEAQRRLIYAFKGLLIKPGASALTYGNR